MTRKSAIETEEKIKQAAKELFLEKGFEGAKTRDITKKANVNLALINYYFWGKEQLFKIILEELFNDFRRAMLKNLNDKNTSFDEKIEYFCDSYSIFVRKNTKLIELVIKKLWESSEKDKKQIKEKLCENKTITQTIFAIQYMEKTKKSIKDFKIFFTNLLSLLIFPILSKPILTTFLDINENEAINMLRKEREKLIPKIVPFIL